MGKSASYKSGQHSWMRLSGQKSQPERFIDLGLIEADQIVDLVLAPRTVQLRPPAAERLRVAARPEIPEQRDGAGNLVRRHQLARAEVPHLPQGRSRPDNIAPTDPKVIGAITHLIHNYHG